MQVREKSDEKQKEIEGFQKIAIIGMGLIGGSIALALKHSMYKGKIIGSDVSMASLEEARKMNAIDIAAADSREAVREADLVVLAVTIDSYEKVFKAIGPFLKENSVVTDVGSVKAHVIELAFRYLPSNIEFLGGHPMAGSEKMGIKAASPYLYENAYYFLTPTSCTSQDALDKVGTFIKMLGAYPVIMDPATHDHVVALISHIPHLTAAMLINLLHRNNGVPYLSFVGGGFRDTTRIASSNPHMWKDIFLNNKAEIIRGIEGLENMLKEFKHMLQHEKHHEMVKILQQAKSIRDKIPSRLKDAIPPVYEIVLNVEDRPGILAELTHLLGENQINIKEIEILHAREGENGAVRIGFETEEERERACALFKKACYFVTCRNAE